MLIIENSSGYTNMYWNSKFQEKNILITDVQRRLLTATIDLIYAR